MRGVYGFRRHFIQEMNEFLLTGTSRSGRCESVREGGNMAIKGEMLCGRSGFVKSEGDGGLDFKVKIESWKGQKDSILNLENRATLVKGMLTGGEQVALERRDIKDISKTHKGAIDRYSDITISLDRKSGAICNVNLFVGRFSWVIGEKMIKQ